MTAPAYPPPPPLSPEVQAALDADHLRLLEIGFYISGIVTGLRFLWFLFMAGLFTVVSLAAFLSHHHGHQGPGNGPPPVLFFFFFAVMLGCLIFLSLIFGVLEIYAGYCLRKRRQSLLIQVVAAFYCLSLPWGTALGVFTFTVLNRPSVKILFARSP
jgi:hypothetical protein